MTFRIARRLMSLATGLAVVSAALPAIAADMGIKDFGGAGGVPVPAPVPIPMYDAEWYIGVAAGAVLSDSAAVTNIGSAMPVNDNLKNVLFGGISAGRYITPSIRAEIAIDAYGDVTLAGPVAATYTDAKTANSTINSGTLDTNHYDVTRTDKVTLGRTTAMLNMFYDIDTGTSFRPYIGGGVGLTWRSMKRKWSEHAECAFTTNNVVHNYPADSCAVSTTDLPASYDKSGSDSTERFDLALAAMAGISYEITPDIIWDNGYQLLWESNGVDISAQTVSGTSTVKYSSALQHHFRTGLRFNID